MLDSHEDWRVWTDWYEARLAGAPSNEALEVARALIADKIWKQGPRAVNAEIARLIKMHAPPEPELGSALAVTQGQLTLTNSEASGEFDHAVQSSLHRRLQALAPRLLEKCIRVGNTHPGLLSIVSEYADLIAEPTEKLDVAAVWAVGTGLLATSDTMSRLPQAGLMAEPLEPEHLAELRQVAAIHGGLILGFELGQKLTDRADRARLQPESLAAIMQAAHEILGRWSRTTNFVEEKTRKFFAAMADSAVEPSWRTARAGYAIFAVTKDGLVALGKVALLFHAVASTFVGGSTLSIIDANLSQHTQFILEFLLDNSPVILSFSDPFPELKFWLVEIIAALKKDRDFRSI